MENISLEQFDRLIVAMEWLGCSIIIAAIIRGFLNK